MEKSNRQGVRGRTMTEDKELSFYIRKCRRQGLAIAMILDYLDMHERTDKCTSCKTVFETLKEFTFEESKLLSLMMLEEKIRAEKEESELKND